VAAISNFIIYGRVLRPASGKKQTRFYEVYRLYNIINAIFYFCNGLEVVVFAEMAR
jgi:hypothetical protein